MQTGLPSLRSAPRSRASAINPKLTGRRKFGLRATDESGRNEADGAVPFKIEKVRPATSYVKGADDAGEAWSKTEKVRPEIA